MYWVWSVFIPDWICHSKKRQLMHLKGVLVQYMDHLKLSFLKTLIWQTHPFSSTDWPSSSSSASSSVFCALQSVWKHCSDTYYVTWMSEDVTELCDIMQPGLFSFGACHTFNSLPADRLYRDPDYFLSVHSVNWGGWRSWVRIFSKQTQENIIIITPLFEFKNFRENLFVSKFFKTDN